MDDFDKPELECLHNAIVLQLKNMSMSQINYDKRVELRDKLQSMIDNYDSVERIKERTLQHGAVHK